MDKKRRIHRKIDKSIFIRKTYPDKFIRISLNADDKYVYTGVRKTVERFLKTPPGFGSEVCGGGEKCARVLGGPAAQRNGRWATGFDGGRHSSLVPLLAGNFPPTSAHHHGRRDRWHSFRARPVARSLVRSVVADARPVATRTRCRRRWRSRLSEHHPSLHNREYS